MVGREKISLSELIERKGFEKEYIAEKICIEPEILSEKLKEPATFSGLQMHILSQILGCPVVNIDFNVNFFSCELDYKSSDGDNRERVS